MHEHKIGKIYVREFVGALGIYAVMLVASIMYGRGLEEGLTRTLVLTSPMVGFFLAIWAVARQLKRVDEYMRQFLLENIAIAAGVTAAVTFTYGFLENAGYPRLSMFAVWVLMGSVWGLAGGVRTLLNRSEQ